MPSKKIQQLEANLKIRNKLLNIGIGCPIMGPTGMPGPTGPQGEIGPTGPEGSSLVEELFSASFLETNDSTELTFDTTWFIPNHSKYFRLLDNHQLEVQPGIYEITFTGLIENADTSHGATFFLENSDGAAIKDLTFILPINSNKQMHFSQTVIFRFEDITILQAATDILGDVGTSNITISEVNLLMKKLNE